MEFIHKYRLVIQNPFVVQVASRAVPVSADDNSVYSLFTPIDYRRDDGRFRLEPVNETRERVITIEDLNMSATIAASGDTDGNNSTKSTIEITNLSPEHRNYVEQANNRVLLYAGYEGTDTNDTNALPLIFVGQVESGSTKKSGTDYVTTLQCADASTPMGSIRIAKSYPLAVSYAYVIEDLVEVWRQNGVAIGEINLNPSPRRTVVPSTEQSNTNGQDGPITTTATVLDPNTTFLRRGLNFTGYLYEAMNTVLGSIGFIWFIVNNTLYIRARGYRPLYATYDIRSDEIYSFHRKVEAGSKSGTEQDTNKWLLEIPLDGRLDKAASVRVRGVEYAIDSVSHRLDYEGSEWKTTLEVMEPSE